MESRDLLPLNIAVRCDALTAWGTGHLMRMIALAEELVSRGHRVAFFGRTDIAWVETQLARRALALHDPDEDFAAQAVAWGADAVVIDGYEIPREAGEGARRCGIPVLALVDAGFGTHQDADLYVDQNLGATRPDGLEGRWIGGERYALLRDVVRERRGIVRPAAVEVPRALIVFGGSDPLGGAPVAAQVLLEAGVPVDVVAVAATSDIVERLRALPMRAPRQTMTVTGPVDDLPALAITCDLAVSAAGSSVWELACLGIPTALVEVVDNQRLGYEAAAGRLCLGLGRLAQLRDDAAQRAEASAQVRRLLAEKQYRAVMAERARRLIDGDGRVRVADEIERLGRARRLAGRMP